MAESNYHPPLNQIAFSVVDLRRTERWFREGLGFLPAGGSRLMMSGPLAAKVQGLPGAASTCWWLVGSNPWFQLELFQFRQPVARLMPPHFRPSDIGYTRIGVHVADFDATLRNFAALGSEPLAPPLGTAGRRRACVRNPDGVYVEIMEDDPLPGSPRGRQCAATMRSVTLSTPDLDASVAYLTAILGHGPEDLPLHGPEHEALWRMAGARCKRAVFQAGDVVVEVVQYTNPLGEPWPAGYRICDQGILNIAFGAHNKRDQLQVYRRAMAFGARPNAKPTHIPGAGVVYVNDTLGFSVEILWIRPGLSDRRWGFVPQPIDKRPAPDNRRVSATVRIAAPVDKVWQVLTQHNAMGRWIGFDYVKRTRDGHPEADGYCSERLMRGQPGTVVEQVTGLVSHESIRYRVIAGSPFVFHNGEIALRPTEAGCEVEWTIRFRSKIPMLGAVFRAVMQRMLSKMLQRGLKPYAEQVG